LIVGDKDAIRVKSYSAYLVHGKNGFAERSKILAEYKSEK